MCEGVGGLGLFALGERGAVGGGADGAVRGLSERDEEDEGVGGPRTEEVAEGRGVGAEKAR